MMKTIVHNSRVKLQVLSRLIHRNVPECAFELSDVKRDGTVIVRFKSTRTISSEEAQELLSGHLLTSGLRFEIPVAGQVRLPLDQIVDETSHVQV